MFRLAQKAIGTPEPFELKPKESGVGGSSELFDLSKIKIGDVLRGLITLALIIAALVFFFMLVIGGIRWIVSGGDKAQTEAARGQITAALIGLVIVFAAWAIGQILGTFFGIDIFTNITVPQVAPTAITPGLDVK